MEKSKKNRLKDYQETKGKKWVYLPTPYTKRKSGSGITFDGKYVDKERGEVHEAKRTNQDIYRPERNHRT